MTCRHTEHVLALDTERLATTDARRLELHARECLECGGVLTSLRAARAIARTHVVTPPSFSRAKIQRAVTVQVRRERAGILGGLAGGPRSRAPAAAAIGALAIAAAAILLARAPEESHPELESGHVRMLARARELERGDTIPRRTPLETKQPSALALGAAKIALEPGARFELGERELVLSQLILDRGTLLADLPGLEDSHPLELVTLDARVSLIDGAVRLTRTDRGTFLEVTRGTAIVWAAGSHLPQTFTAGSRAEIAARVPRLEIPGARNIQPEITGASNLPAEKSPQGVVAPASHSRGPASSPLENTSAIGATRRASALAENLDGSAQLDPNPSSGAQRREVPAAEGVAGRDKRSPEPPTRRDPAPADPSATLEEARHALTSNAPRAAELAERVLEKAPSKELEADALAVLADAQRRRGHFEEAADLYGRLADHPRGTSYAEESLLQRALILARIAPPKVTLEDLARAEARFPKGPTAPERAALAAHLYLLEKQPLAAAEAIERAAEVGRSLELLHRRVEVARALLPAHRDRARTLLAPVLDPESPRELRSEALELMKK